MGGWMDGLVVGDREGRDRLDSWSWEIHLEFPGSNGLNSKQITT